MELNSDSRIAFVCRGGPENGPFSAGAASVIYEALIKRGLNLSGIYVCSGSTATALLGCTGEFNRLCTLWANITPQDIVGKVYKIQTIYRTIRKESMFRSVALGKFISKNWNLDAIFSPGAVPIKIPALDLLSGELIIFSNKNPKHKQWFLEGVLGSKALIPFLNPQFVYNPEEAELIEKSKSRQNALLLIDGGYNANILLEQAVRDQFDLIFLIDIHGLVPTEMDLSGKFFWPNLLRSAVHCLSATNDMRQFQMVDRINEEIIIKKELEVFYDELPEEQRERLKAVIDRMNNGRLRLEDKDNADIQMVSNQNKSSLFNFVKFKRQDVVSLLEAGIEAGQETIKRMGLVE
ncbi:MAG: hypothetical protein HYT64_02925 [Candidatus Yanofskybacteria bacterium]|nr:hypothetical protein [Candidatus Yanofskybacteria bacterium]